MFDTAMKTLAWATLETPTGAFGLVWSEAGVVRTWLHEQTVGRTRRQISRAFPSAAEAAPPSGISDTLASVAALLDGQYRIFETELDMSEVPAFDRRVYEVARTIPPGETRTYGAISKALGEEPTLARDVGQALARNPFAPIVPCHRVVAAGGQVGGYSAPGGASTKRRLLKLEGAAIVAVGPQQQVLFDRA